MVKKSIKTEDLLKTEIKFHEDKMKIHSDMMSELIKKLKIMKGELKVVPTKVFEEHKNNSDRLVNYQREEEQKSKGLTEAMLDHASITPEVRKDGTTVGQDKSKGEMRKEALKIIETPGQ